MTESAVPRFEAAGAVPTLPVLRRLARSLGVELSVQLAQSSVAGAPRPNLKAAAHLGGVESRGAN
ncbi:MAG TPA: hypothetical protein VF734_07720 [Pseudonocardiaceae bacterium]